MKDELRFALIASGAELKALSEAPASAEVTENEALRVEVQASLAPKCARCWHRREDVGQNKEHPEICERCVENIESTFGEVRYYV